MLTRIFIDNFRCFVNFEHKPAQKELVIGTNGSGKSSFLDAILFLRRVVRLGHDLQRRKILDERTSWIERPNQTFELEASLDGAKYAYRLVLDSYGDPPRARIVSESVAYRQTPIFRFADGNVTLFNDHFKATVTYPFDWHRSALATISDFKDNGRLMRFKRWFDGLLCFRINPFGMKSRTEDEDSYPYFDLRNFAAWYRHLVQADREEDAALLSTLREVLDGFSFLKLRSVGDKLRSLIAEFKSDKNSTIELELEKLSDGQRCLICLYTILHFVLNKGNTIIVDEPENFISLREIQPWLNSVFEAVNESGGQIIIMSHHPEIMNQWAPDFGVQFFREDLGPVRVRKFSGEEYSSLSPSEIISRGWENE